LSRPFILDQLFQASKSISGVGPRLTKLFEKIAGNKIADLLWHIPSGIIDRRNCPKISKAMGGEIATITLIVDEHIPGKRRTLPYHVRCHDETGTMDLIFFNVKGDYLERKLPIGQTRVVSGRLEVYRGKLQMPHPDIIAHLDEIESVKIIEPVYPLTTGITNKVATKIIHKAVEKIKRLDEWHEPTIIKKYEWPTWDDALRRVHFPKDERDILPDSPSRQRLAYDELLSNQLTIALLRQSQKKHIGRALLGNEELYEKALGSLPFELTNSQKDSINDILKDMREASIMLRLLQGDVGSGKTVVAFMAMIHAIGSGGQAAIMAPTEVLARQHYKSISKLAEELGLKIISLTGRNKGKQREEILEQIASGNADIIIGTHALFQEDVKFKNLVLAIIDEQHRFGVHQRLQLAEKGKFCDVLVMTATPIPRTLTLTAYGDMDVSRLTEKPAGRKPIDTRVISHERINEVIEALHRKIAAGERIYWVCPLVEESEKLDLAAAEDRYDLMQNIFGDEHVGLLHGRMKPKEKDTVMQSFSNGALDILVATTVIEVGVDVPQATVMVIEHAERFGLSQLHQLRGRIGRGEGKSVCILMSNVFTTEIARQRLKIMRETEDGFLIAEEDLKLRGAGEILGTRQSGMPSFKLADLEFHKDLIQMAFDDARLIIERDPNMVSERGKNLRTLLYLFERDLAIKYIRSG